jgi:hypothetical protein
MIDIGRITVNLKRTDEDTWSSPDSSRIDYPVEGNSVYFEVEDASFWFQHRNDCILSAIKRYPPPGPIFDIGGGNGFVAKAMADAGFPAILVEPGAMGIVNARRRGLTPVIQSTLEGAKFREASLPAIGLFDVLEHIDDDLGFLRLAHCLAIPSGMIYVTVPAHNWLWSHEDAAAGHFRRYRLDALHRLLQKSGWEPVFATYFFSFLPLPILLLRCLPYYLGIRYSNEVDAKKTLVASQHENSLWRFFRPIFGWEKGRCSAGKKIPLGASCLVVGRRAS